MFKFIASAFGYILNFIYNLVNNYGLAIIIFTVLLKLIMLPLTIKQQKTMKKTTEMQAKVKEIQNKYSNDQLRMSQELTDLYKRENVSPFSGCLTSLVQFFVILSIFYLVSSPLTYMKHVDQEIITKYTEEVREELGPENVRYPEIAIIKVKAKEDENVNLNMDFFGLDLSDVPTQDYDDPRVFIIPGLYIFTSLVLSKFVRAMTMPKKEEVIENKLEDKKKTGKELVKTNDGKDDSINEEDAIEQMNKSMNLMMPIMTVSIACIAPLGLALYWLVSNLLGIAERLLINKVVKEEE